METLQTDRRLGRKTGLLRRRRNHTKNKTAKPAAIDASYAFLKQEFTPVSDLALNNTVTIAAIEMSYYASLDHLSKLYHFRPRRFLNLPYPSNIANSFEHAKQRLAKKDRLLELVIVSKDDGSVCLATAREYDTNLTLLMMPMDALSCLHRAKNFQSFRLLLSCYAYLYQKTGMELCDQGSYVFGCYETNQEWIENEESFMDEEEYKGYYLLFAYMKRCLKILNREVKNQCHLNQFSQRIRSFEPVSVFDKQLLSSAQTLFDLHTKFPDRSFTENSSGKFLHTEVEEMGYLYQYFTFCWSTEGILIDQYTEYVNSDLQEREALDQPMALQLFDREQKKSIHDFSFEEALQDAIGSLAEILNQLT